MCLIFEYTKPVIKGIAPGLSLQLDIEVEVFIFHLYGSPCHKAGHGFYPIERGFVSLVDKTVTVQVAIDKVTDTGCDALINEFTVCNFLPAVEKAVTVGIID